MRVKVWVSSLLIVLAFVVAILLVSCGQNEATPTSTTDQTPMTVPEPADESLISEKSNGDDDEPAVSVPAIDARSTSSDDQKSSGSRLATALQMLNPELSDPQPRNIGFTDWSLVKEYMGLHNLDGTSSVEDKRSFVAAFGENQVAGAGEWLSSDS